MTRPINEDRCLKDFGLRLAAIREHKGMSQEKLGSLAGVTRETISHLENGRQWARLSMLHKIAKALRVPTSYLLEDLKQ